MSARINIFSLSVDLEISEYPDKFMTTVSENEIHPEFIYDYVQIVSAHQNFVFSQDFPT